VDGLRRLGGEGRRPATVLKVPHHGAKSSLDPEWLSAVHPRYAVISVGRANPYGHPVQAVLDAYVHEQASIMRTDRDGAIWVTGRVSSPDIVLIRMRDLLLQPVVRRSGLWRGERENWHRILLQFRDFSPLPFFM
jgi:competence protein ComEC